MALTCTQPGLTSVVPGSLLELSQKQKQALLVLYLYREQNPSTVGEVVPAADLIEAAKCFACAPSESDLLAYEVWIQRQAAADAGASFGTFDAGTTMAELKCLTCLSLHQLRAIEILLRCGL
jgi:hypothetical protein